MISNTDGSNPADEDLAVGAIERFLSGLWAHGCI
jgi:hypothetical protein